MLEKFSATVNDSLPRPLNYAKFSYFLKIRAYKTRSKRIKLAMSKNAMKRTYGNIKIQIFPGLYPARRLKGMEEQGEGREGEVRRI
jgi:hypothetical protein